MFDVTPPMPKKLGSGNFLVRVTPTPIRREYLFEAQKCVVVHTTSNSGKISHEIFIKAQD